jgi:ABC-type microcin C transport system permease subunit YejE
MSVSPAVASPSKEPIKFESTSQPGLFFWAESDGEGAWIVTSQANGFPATEAYDDWLGVESQAVDIAKRLAAGDPCLR